MYVIPGRGITIFKSVWATYRREAHLKTNKQLCLWFVKERMGEKERAPKRRKRGGEACGQPEGF